LAKDGEAPRIAADALVWEIADWALYGEELDQPTLSGDRGIRAIGGLLRRRLVRCPTCLRELPTLAELARCQELSRRAIDEAAIRERAPHREVVG
jgi:hypothetical protein